MNYLLAVLTCGRPEYLTPTLASFAEFLYPAPAELYAWDDGLSTPDDVFFDAFPDIAVTIDGASPNVGRCTGHARLWQTARERGFDWVFTIEDDLVLLRPLRVDHMMETMSYDPQDRIAQLALIRCPWGAEIPHGGYVPMNPHRYTRETTRVGGGRDAHWMSSTYDWASSPALVRSRVFNNVDWPEGRDCEHRLGPAILGHNPNAVSGYWGWGEPLVAHIGMERVAGAHGY